MNASTEFCTCPYTDCQNHPTNHDQGCNPCIQKNLSHGEIPCCFFNKLGPDATAHGYHFADFAKAVLNASKEGL